MNNGQASNLFSIDFYKKTLRGFPKEFFEVYPKFVDQSVSASNPLIVNPD